MWPMGLTRVNGETVICSGHEFEVDQNDPVEDVLAKVTVTRCKDCGKHEVDWTLA